MIILSIVRFHGLAQKLISEHWNDIYTHRYVQSVSKHMSFTQPYAYNVCMAHIFYYHLVVLLKSDVPRKYEQLLV